MLDDAAGMPVPKDEAIDVMWRDSYELLKAQGSPICEVRLGLDGRVRSAWNTESVFGWAPSQLLGQLLWEVIRPEANLPSHPEYSRLTREVIEGKRPVFRAAGPARHASGERVLVICTVTAERANGSSKPFGLVCRYAPIDVLA